MRRPLVFFLFLLMLGLRLALLAQQQPAPPSRHRFLFLKGSNEVDLLAQMNEAAADGYRAVAGTGIVSSSILDSSVFSVLMEKVASPPDIYRYRLAGGGKARSRGVSEDDLNQVGLAGYRLVPRFGWWMLMEKEPHPHNYQYVYAALKLRGKGLGGLFTGFPPITGPAKITISDAVRQGFQAVRWQGDFIMEREAEQAPAAVPDPQFLLVSTFRTSSLAKKVAETAAQGYRIFCAVPDRASKIGGGITVIMEKPPNPAGNYEYVFLGFSEPARMQAEMNAKGAKGFRLHPATLEAKDFAMEKAPGSSKTFQYLVLADRPVTTLYSELEVVTQAGYKVVAAIGYRVILEKSTEKP